MVATAVIWVDGVPEVFYEYPNGETRCESINPMGTRVRFRYENDSDLLKLVLVANHLEDRNLLVIDYMPYSRMDRVKNGRQVFSLKYVANLINSLGFRNVVVVEPHSDVTCALLDRSWPFWAVEMLVGPVLRNIATQERPWVTDFDYVVFPDGGAAKRYEGLKDPWGRPFRNVLIGNKHRNFDTGKIESLELIGPHPEPTGRPRRALIVDDLSSYGGTFVLAAKAIRGMSEFDEVHLLVAHAEPVIVKGELFDHVDSVHCTDSMNPPRHEKMTIYPLEDLL